MSKLRLDFEWLDPAGAEGEELRATWASLSILLDDVPVTELLDRRTRSVRSRVFLPLFPLAEWLTKNWWFLQSEAGLPEYSENREFDLRHNLRWAREGFALPSLRFVTLGENVEARWQPLDIPDAGIKFLADGVAELSAESFVKSLRDFINAVVTRLDDCGLSQTSLHEEWLAIERLDADELDFCHAAARLGADPFSVDHQLEAAIIDSAGRVRPELLDEFLSLATVDQLSSRAAALEAASQSIATDTDSVDALKDLRRLAPQCPVGLNAWETGYRFAAALRAGVNGGHWKSRSLSELAGHLGIDQLEHCLLPDTGTCGFLDALAGTNQFRHGKILVEKKRDDSRQFAFCRALFELLTLAPNCFAAVSRLRTERQQRNRAFAAEFLVPHQLLKNDLSGSMIEEEEVDELAHEYGVSAFVIRHQIQNHSLAHVSP